MSSANFRGGPATGQSFHGLLRTPTLLRVVRDYAGKLDVLNDLDDRVRDDECVEAVYLLDVTTRVHVCGRGANRDASGWYVTYVHVPVVDVRTLADEDTWLAYVAATLRVPVEEVQRQREGERA